MNDAKNNVELQPGDNRMSAPWKIMLLEVTRLFQAADYLDLAFDQDVEDCFVDGSFEGELHVKNR